MSIFTWLRRRKLLLIGFVLIATIYAKMLVASINERLPKKMTSNIKIVQIEKRLVEEAKKRGDLKSLQKDAEKDIEEIKKECSKNECEVEITRPPFADELYELQLAFGDLSDKKIKIDEFMDKVNSFKSKYGKYREAMKDADLLIKDAKEMGGL